MASVDMEPDFSHLPEVVWVEVMKYLFVPERAGLAATCKSLNSVFNHPSLWHTVKIHLLGDFKSYNYKNQAVLMSKQYRVMAQKFGRYFQCLYLNIVGYVKTVPDDCKVVIAELSKHCRLEKLVLHVGTMVSHQNYYSVNPTDSDLQIFTDFVENAFRLKSFTLTSWPRFPEQDTLDILQSLKANKKLCQLQELNLYTLSASRDSWVTNNPVLPSQDQVLGLIKHFRNLHTLSVRSTMLSDDIIEELATPPRKPLENLSVLVTYTEQERRRGMVTISQRNWAALRDFCPEIRVDFTVMTRVPFVELCGVLSPEILLHTIRFLRYSRCGSMDIASLTDKFSKTLTCFVDYTDASDCDRELVAMVTKCSSLDCLTYNGALHVDTVLDLARLRGRRWRVFSINIDKVQTKAPSNEDDDQVIRVGPNGDLVTPLTQNYESEEERVEALRRHELEIAEIIGHKMVPPQCG